MEDNICGFNFKRIKSGPDEAELIVKCICLLHNIDKEVIHNVIVTLSQSVSQNVKCLLKKNQGQRQVSSMCLL
jgi:hypothetical protein